MITTTSRINFEVAANPKGFDVPAYATLTEMDNNKAEAIARSIAAKNKLCVGPLSVCIANPDCYGSYQLTLLDEIGWIKGEIWFDIKAN